MRSECAQNMTIIDGTHSQEGEQAPRVWTNLFEDLDLERRKVSNNSDKSQKEIKNERTKRVVRNTSA